MQTSPACVFAGRLVAPSYSRRIDTDFPAAGGYDSMGLIWLLQGRPVIALTESQAAIQSAGAVVTYRKLNKPALGPLDMELRS
jgi:hypothetical protein